MCGIAGFVDPAAARPAAELHAIAAAMAATLRHRGPDAQGTWADPSAGVAFGHRRLSILDLSPTGAQPMTSHCGRYVITYNGEIYNFGELKRALTAEGAEFRGTSDTEVLLAAIATWGFTQVLPRLNGMFAIAVWDRASRTLLMARDRVGEKPLYFGYAGRCFIFASELRALRAHPDFEANIDTEVLSRFLKRSYVAGNHSILGGINRLAPGSFLTWQPARREPEIRRYWSLDNVAADGLASPFDGPPTHAIHHLAGLLRDSVRSRMVADVPVGAFLSGGLDSAVLVAMMQIASSQPVKTFTVGFADCHYDESSAAEMIASHLGTDHTTLTLQDEDLLAVIPRLPAIYDEPHADPSQIPTSIVCALAREKVTVALSGDGGDELFCGYNTYHAAQRVWNSIRWLPPPARRGLAAALKSAPQPILNALFSPLVLLDPRITRSEPLGQKIRKLAPLLAAPDREVFKAQVISGYPDGLPCITTRPTCDGGGAPQSGCGPKDIARVMMLADQKSYLPDDILTKVDRAAMSVSLETRMPFLDHRLISIAWRLPVNASLPMGQSKPYLRAIARRYLPDHLVPKRKSGFAVPLAAWLRGPLREMISDLTSPSKLRREGLLNADLVTSLWREHLTGSANWDKLLWAVAVFELWLAASTAGGLPLPQAQLTGTS